MAGRPLTPTATTYAQLRDAVMTVVVHGRQQIERAWVETYHETGRLINEHILQFRDRADYGAGVYEKLSADTGVSVRTLRECAQFQRYFPIRRTCAELDWSKCRLLCQVPDDAQRTILLRHAVKNQWTASELEARVRRVNAATLGPARNASAPPVELLTPRRGTPGLHPIVDRGAGPEVDLGFKIYRALGAASKLTTGDIVRLDAGGLRKIETATKADLFTYTAAIRKVVDGDTLVIALAIAPGFTHELKLRLRGLDCPELSTVAGRAAKAVVDRLVRAGDEVILSTTKPDKYDRYLADVFVRRKMSDGQATAGNGSTPPGADSTEVFLNNLLLESGHAVRYDGGAKEE